MKLVSQLGYLGFEVSDMQAWIALSRDVIGADVGAPEADGTIRCRIDDYEWRYALHQGPLDDMAYAGWECPTLEAFEAACAAVTQFGLKVERTTAELAKTRKVMGLASFVVGGLPMELYYGPNLKREIPLKLGRTHSGFKTGIGGLGHIVVQTPEMEQTVALFRDVLGFRVSDYIWDITFMRCNPRHHSIAVEPGKVGDKRLAHFMLETHTLDDTGHTWDLVRKHEVPFKKTLGKHINDKMISFYMQTPSGFDLEYGCDAIEPDDATWTVAHYDAPSIWGHKRPNQA